MYVVYAVSSLSHIAGGTRVIVEHINGLAARGHKIEVWTSDINSPSYFQTDTPILEYDASRLGKPDVVVLTDLAYMIDAAKYRQHKRTFLLLQHDNEWTGEIMGIGSYAHFMLECKDLFDDQWEVITVSSWLQDVIKQKYNIDSHVVANGVDTKIFHKSRPAIATSNPKILLYFDPQPWKGFLDAATAAIEVKKQMPTLGIIIMGAFFPQTPPGTRFSFPAIYFNTPMQSEMAGIYSSADVFVSASWQEGFGLPGLEALACGVPLVTTDSGGVLEYAIPDKTALVVPPKNTRALIEAIREVLGNQTLRHKLTNEGHKMATTLNWSKTIQKLESILMR